MEKVMEKIIDILSYLISREQELAEKIVTQAFLHDSDALLNNAAHEEIQKLLVLCAKLIKEEKDEKEEKENKKQKLRLVK